MRFRKLYEDKLKEFLDIVDSLEIDKTEMTYRYFPHYCGPVVVKLTPDKHPVGIYQDKNEGYMGYILNNQDILRDYQDGTYKIIFFDPVFKEMITADTHIAFSLSSDRDNVKEIYESYNLPENLYEWTSEQETLYKLSK